MVLLNPLISDNEYDSYVEYCTTSNAAYLPYKQEEDIAIISLTCNEDLSSYYKREHGHLPTVAEKQESMKQAITIEERYLRIFTSPPPEYDVFPRFYELMAEQMRIRREMWKACLVIATDGDTRPLDVVVAKLCARDDFSNVLSALYCQQRLRDQLATLGTQGDLAERAARTAVALADYLNYWHDAGTLFRLALAEHGVVVIDYPYD